MCTNFSAQTKKEKQNERSNRIDVDNKKKVKLKERESTWSQKPLTRFKSLHASHTLYVHAIR